MPSKELYLDCATAMLTALTEAGIPADIQELLVRGDVSLGIAPGALSKAVKASSNTILAAISEPTEGMLEAGCRAWGVDIDADETRENIANEWRQMIAASALGEQSE